MVDVAVRGSAGNDVAGSGVCRTVVFYDYLDVILLRTVVGGDGGVVRSRDGDDDGYLYNAAVAVGDGSGKGVSNSFSRFERVDFRVISALIDRI